MQLEQMIKENFYNQWTPSLNDMDPLNHPEWFLDEALAKEFEDIKLTETELKRMANQHVVTCVTPSKTKKKQSKITTFLQQFSNTTISNRTPPSHPPLSEISFVDDEASHLTETSVSF